MSMGSTKSRLEKLVVTTEIPSSLIVDFVALCTYGKVVAEDSFEVKDVLYKVASIADGSVTISPSADGATFLQNDKQLAQLVTMFLAAKLLGAEVQIDGTWSGRYPSQRFVETYLPESERITDRNQVIHAGGCLTLNDLEDVHRHLVGEKRPASELLYDKAFRTVFPAMQTKWGDYGFVRHRSGTEVRTSWREKEFISGYGYESPSPCETALNKWKDELKIETDDDQFRKYRVKSWELGKLLSRVPSEHKQRVYEWVVDTTFTVEEYHDTHGGRPIPETFECEFDNSIVTADRNLNFELIEV